MSFDSVISGSAAFNARRLPAQPTLNPPPPLPDDGRCGHTGGRAWRWMWSGANLAGTTIGALAGDLAADAFIVTGPGVVPAKIVGWTAGAGAGAAIVDGVCSRIEDGAVDRDRALRVGLENAGITAIGGTAGRMIGGAAATQASRFPAVAVFLGKVDQKIVSWLPSWTHRVTPTAAAASRDMAGNGVGFGASYALPVEAHPPAPHPADPHPPEPH